MPMSHRSLLASLAGFPLAYSGAVSSTAQGSTPAASPTPIKFSDANQRFLEMVAMVPTSPV